MGSVFEFVVIEEDSAKAQEYFKQVIEEIDRIENLISEWRPYTQISEVNRQAGIRPVKVNKEVLYQMRHRSISNSLGRAGLDLGLLYLL